MNDRFWLFIARLMPRKLVYWCAIVLGAEVTTGAHSTTIVPELRFMDAISRYPLRERGQSTLAIVLIVLLVLLLIGGIPAWGVHPYGWGVSGIAGLLLVVLLILLLLGRL